MTKSFSNKKIFILLIVAITLATFSIYGYTRELNKNLSKTVYDRIEEVIILES